MQYVTMSCNSSILECSFSALFEKKISVFHENVPSQDIVTDEIWWKVFLTLLTQNPE